IGIPFFDGGDLQGIAGNLEEMTVEEAMNPNVVSVGPDDSVASLAAKMRNNKIHRLIVADDDKVVGVVTTFDLLKLLENQ
ncbi:MAG: CBS domain-containing protein, partial [Bdellovibrionales bacterium]|nr:CBS domain-containing protein [Bdellovibrionales bacterium]